MTTPNPTQFLSRTGFRAVSSADIFGNLSGVITSLGMITSFNTAPQALPNGYTATTQAPGDNTTKIATDAFVTAAISAFSANIDGGSADTVYGTDQILDGGNA